MTHYRLREPGDLAVDRNGSTFPVSTFYLYAVYCFHDLKRLIAKGDADMARLTAKVMAGCFKLCYEEIL